MFRRRKTAKKSVASSDKTVAKFDFATLSLQADRAFKKAAKAAVAENDRLSIATHGSVGGNLVVHAPVRRRRPALD